MTIYEAVKHTVPVPDAAARYGLDVSRNGMARCPFHNDRNPSMKLNDDYYFCFGCGERGDVIDLTAGLYGLNNYDAVHKLADDFGVGYETVILDPAKIEQKRLEREWEQEKERQVFLSLTERLYVLRDWIVRFAPKSEPEALDEELDPRFVEACHDLARVEYLVDVLCTGDEREKREVVKELRSHQILPEAPEKC